MNNNDELSCGYHSRNQNGCDPSMSCKENKIWDYFKTLSVAYKDPDFTILFFGFSWSYRFEP